MGNFIDKTFTVIADLLLKLLPTNKKAKQAFSYYRAGLAAQTKGRYAEALRNYFESLKLEEDPNDRGYTLYNIGVIYGNLGKKSRSLEYYHQAIALNPTIPQAFANIGAAYHMHALRAQQVRSYEYAEIAKELFDKAGEYWLRAVELSPGTYPGFENWLKLTGRVDSTKYAFQTAEDKKYYLNYWWRVEHKDYKAEEDYDRDDREQNQN